MNVVVYWLIVSEGDARSAAAGASSSTGASSGSALQESLPPLVPREEDMNTPRRVSMTPATSPSAQPDDESVRDEDAFWQQEARRFYDDDQRQLRYLIGLWEGDCLVRMVGGR